MAFEDASREDALFNVMESRYGRRIREAFRASAQELRNSLTLEQIVRLIEERGVASAEAILQQAARGEDSPLTGAEAAIVAPIFATVGEEYEEAFTEAARQRAQDITENVRGPRGPVQHTFQITEEQTAARVREGQARLIREISDEQRRVIENVIQNGLNASRDTRRIARDVEQSIGLTEKQERAVRNYRRLLEQGSADALDRELRDRRFDPTVQDAVDGEIQLSPQQIDRMVERYRARMVRHRAEVIARTESLRALSEGKDEAVRQMVRAGEINSTQIKRRWRTARNERVRPHHRAIPGMNPDGVGLDESFQTPLGPLRYPRDPQGAPENVINCQCILVYRIEDA